jgi:hypothetical protein
MSERSERIIVTAPKAHGCAISAVDLGPDHEAMVHQ